VRTGWNTKELEHEIHERIGTRNTRKNAKSTRKRKVRESEKYAKAKSAWKRTVRKIGGAIAWLDGSMNAATLASLMSEGAMAQSPPGWAARWMFLLESDAGDFYQPAARQ
jgi:hypothetical protein